MRARVLFVTVEELIACNNERTRESAMVNDNLTPAWEVVLRVEGICVCTVAAFRDTGDKFVILVGVQEQTRLLAYADMLRESAFRVAVARGFMSVDQVAAGAGGNNDESAIPF